MDYTIWIQSVDNYPISDDTMSAFIGFREKGGNIKLFEDIEEVPISRYNIIVGFIEETSKYFKKLGIETPLSLNIPSEIRHYAGRKISETTMGEFRKDNTYPIFAKPNGLAKEFVAGVIKKTEDKILFLKDVPDESPVLLSEVVSFTSEWRGYVINGELQTIKHYLGDFRIFPDTKIIESAIKDYKSAPIGYSIDFGITNDGKTLLIECNDGWSLGNYGLDSSTYSKLLAKRWLQIIN